MNPTQVIGILTFVAAGISGWWAGNHSRHLVWRSSSVLYGILAIEVMTGFRHGVQTAVRSFTYDQGLYEERRFYQPFLIVVVCCVVTAILGYCIWRNRRGGAPVFGAFTSVALIAALFFTEIVSLHGIDAVLYRRVGDILAIGIFWVIAVIPHFVGAYWEITRAKHEYPDS